MLQQKLEEFQSRLSTFRESLGVIGDGETGDDVPDLSPTREALFEALSTAAITQNIRFELDTATVVLDKVHRIEHQSWLRGETEAGKVKVVNVMDVNDVEPIQS